MNSLRIHRTGCVLLTLVAVACFACAVFWPAWAERAVGSRLLAGFIAVWCGLLAALLHPELRAGLTQGVREFSKACRDVNLDINDDDDDHPHPA
jgi:hypothetical protein